MMMEAVDSSEMLEDFCQTTRHHILEDCNALVNCFPNQNTQII